VVTPYLRTSDDELGREIPPLSPSCEKITEADQEDCSLIMDEHLEASPDAGDSGQRKLEHVLTANERSGADPERRKKKKEQQPKAHDPIDQQY
jgi:hypothetical protein